jgi:TonB-linked SusC/RagA family outer membrane protein
MIRFILSQRQLCFILAFFMVAGSAYAQTTVTGKVISMIDNAPMPGVSVIIKGTNNGTASDANGAFSLSVSGPDAVLVLSFIGYQSEEVTVGTQTRIEVSMSPSLEQLMEVVVVGYSEKKKQEITGAVSNLSADQIKGVTGSNLEYMLQGKVAGVQVSSATGAPGTPAEIRIRGNSSISADRGALIVVDGIIGGSYNPNDIETVTVLKDAGAIAMYGSRASGGVVIITTKRATSEKPTITYRTTLGQRQITTGKFKLMNAQELYDTERTMFASSAAFNALRPANVLNNDTDWLNLAYKKGMVQNHNLSASGKTGRVGYYLSGDYYNEEGTLLSTGYKRFNMRSNLDIELSKKVRLNTNINVTRDNTDTYHWRWPYQPFLYLPYDTPYDAAGNIRYVDANTPGFLTRDKNSILQSALYNDYQVKGFNINGDVILTADILPWLTVQSRNRVGFVTYRSDSYEDLKTIEGAANNGILSFGVSEGYSVISTNLLKFNRDFGDHSLGGFVGFEGQQYSSRDAGANGYGIVSGIKIPGGVASPQGISGTETQARAMSVLSELSYNYKEKYFATASFRRDGSSIFGANKRWGNFGALSASWLLSKEDFFMPFSNVATLVKLRGSYGIVGNDAVPPFQYLAKYNFSNQYNGGSAGYPETLPNADLGWEQTKTGDIGLDATFFNRLDVTVDVYNKDTDKLLLWVQLPPSQGINQVLRNTGRVVNNGIELSIGGDVIRTSKVKWSVNFNIGSARNRVKELAPGTTAVNKYYDGLKQSIQVGHDINSWYLPKWAGVNSNNGDPQWERAVLDGTTVTGYEVTNSYADASSTSSLQFVGSATPKFFGGISSNVSYKGFTLGVSTAYQYGNKIYHRTREFIDADGGNFNFNMMKLADGWSRWLNPGDQATHPRAVYGGNLQSNKPSSRYLEDGSHLRIRNIRLAYNIPLNILSKLKIANASVFISADNLFTFTKFSGMDPEVSSMSRRDTNTLGLDIAGLSDFKYPISKQFLAGLQISL